MSTFVLVSGGGLGGWSFQRVARLLEAQGHTVYSPTLTGVGDRGHLVSADVDLDTHITDVRNLLFFEAWSLGARLTASATESPSSCSSTLPLADQTPRRFRPLSR